MTEISEQFKEGWDAFEKGKEIFDNPYYPEAQNVVKRADWGNGWETAHQEYIRAMSQWAADAEWEAEMRREIYGEKP